MFEKLKRTFLIIIFVIAFILYEITQYNSQKNNYDELEKLSGEMKKNPISIVYVIVVIMTLYFIGKLKFFEGVQIGKNDPFDRDRKSKGKEIIATIVFGLIFIIFVIGFFVIMLK